MNRNEMIMANGTSSGKILAITQSVNSVPKATSGSVNTLQPYRTQRMTNHHFKGEVDKLERTRGDLIRRNKHLRNLVIYEKQKLSKSVTGRVLEHQRLRAQELQRQKIDAREKEEKARSRVELAECTQKNTDFQKQHTAKVHEIAEKLRYQASMEHRKQVEEEFQTQKEMEALEKKEEEFKCELEAIMADVEKLNENKNDKENKISRLELVLSSAKSETSQSVSNCKTLAEENDALELEISEMKESNANMKSEITARKQRIAADLSAHQSLDKKIQSLAAQVWAQQRKLEAAKGTSHGAILSTAKRKRKL